MAVYRVASDFQTTLHGFKAGYEVDDKMFGTEGALPASDYVRLGLLEPIGGEVPADPAPEPVETEVEPPAEDHA
jgi:hypothetical protein